jgi:predicted DNA-binding transcriptional regulator AlpA
MSHDDFLDRSALPLPLRDISKAHRNRLIKKGEFPRPVYLTARKPVWRRIDVERWLKSKLDAQTAA